MAADQQHALARLGGQVDTHLDLDSTRLTVCSSSSSSSSSRGGRGEA
jgi:hypothetical protein